MNHDLRYSLFGRSKAAKKGKSSLCNIFPFPFLLTRYLRRGQNKLPSSSPLPLCPIILYLCAPSFFLFLPVHSTIASTLSLSFCPCLGRNLTKIQIFHDEFRWDKWHELGKGIVEMPKYHYHHINPTFCNPPMPILHTQRPI